MPELPEVETIKNSLKKSIINKTIADIEILSSKNFIGNQEEIIGKKIIGIKRYGKVLAIKLSNHRYLNIHLKLTGQLLFSPNLKKAIFSEKIPFTNTNKLPGKTTRIIIKFADGSGIFFNDLRKFGWLKIADNPEIPKGVDVLSKDFTLKFLTGLTKTTKRPIKILLMDQDKITGIGNIYANDALFLAKIHPLRGSNTLSNNEIKNLYQAILKVIDEGIKDKGSSGADEAYVLPDGSKGTHQRHFLVYQREGKPCPKCKTKIKRIKQGGRSSFFCPRCQPSSSS